jgi:hypothetical protein
LRPRPWFLSIDGSVTVAYAPSTASLTPGGSLRLEGHASSWSLGIQAGALAPVSLSAAPGSADLLVFPGTFAASYGFRLGPALLEPRLGVAADLLVMRGVDVLAPREETRLDVGVDVGAQGTLGLGAGWAIGLAVDARAFPIQYRLIIEPNGVENRTPTFWLFGSLLLRWSGGRKGT